MLNIKLSSQDKKDIKKYISKSHNFNDDTGEFDYYEYDLIFLRNEWNNEKSYQVAICRKNDECENIDKEDLDFWYDTEEWNVKMEDKIIKMFLRELENYKDIIINDICKSKFSDI